MKSTFPILWGSARNLQPEHRIERVLYGRTHRMVAGLAYDQSFQQMVGTLAVVTGFGKFLRLKHSVHKTVFIPEVLGQQCRQIFQQFPTEIQEIQALLADLANLQAGLVERLKSEAGKYVDRILAVSISEPGIWHQDFDGKLNYSSFCDPVTLAELTGMNVVDSFPGRDIMVGGSGKFLESLPLWLLAAERNQTLSHKNRLVWGCDRQPTFYFLPASDGIDAEVPEIQVFQLLANRIEKICGKNSKWRPTDVITDQTNRRLCDTTQATSPFDSKNFADPLKHLIADWAKEGELEIVLGESDLQLIEDPLGWKAFPAVSLVSLQELGCCRESLPAVVAALLGFLHIDQLPGNLPWITGGSGQRILGRLTAGRPSQWRQLIRVMADYQPAAMKLKDAV